MCYDFVRMRTLRSILVPLILLGFCPWPAGAVIGTGLRLARAGAVIGTGLSLARAGAVVGAGLSLAGAGAAESGPAITGTVEKADRLGRAARFWTEETSAWSEAWFAPAGNAGDASRVLLERDPGTLFSPTLDFDAANRAWAAWIRAGDTSAEIRLRDIAAGRTWTVARTETPALSQVRLAAALDGAVWIVWTQQARDGAEVRARSLAVGKWGPAILLNAKRPGPCLALHAAAGPDGEPWVYWSAFDGHDYEIEGARRRSGRWSAAPALTANGLDDLLDGLGLESGRFTASWKRPASSPRAVLKRTWTGSGWGPETGAPDAPRKASPRIPSALARLKPAEPVEPLPAPNVGLDDDTYICLGDSITYGVLNGDYHPELGYVPRLQALLTAAFGTANTVNAGVPGEVTFNGLGRLDGLIETHRGRYALIMEGTNDVVFNEIPMEASAFHVEQMIRKCVRARVFPLLATILPRTDGRWDRKFYRDRILALNASLRNIAQNLHVPLVDQFAVFYDYPEPQGGFRVLFSDGNHPNEVGYDLMSRAWFDGLRRVPFCPAAVTARRVVERSLLASRTLDVVSWPHNPKILDPTPFFAYRVYRRDAAAPDQAFELIAALPFSIYHSPQTFFDFAVVPDRRYAYAVALVRSDGIEGPLSNPAED